MDIDKLIESMLKDINDKFMLQAVFDRHIERIEQLKVSGFSYKQILIAFNEGSEKKIKPPHFQNLLFRAKNKIEKKTINNVVEVKEVKEVKEKPQLTENNNWLIETNIDIPFRMIERLENHGFTPEKIIELGLKSSAQISKYLTNYEHKKSKGT